MLIRPHSISVNSTKDTRQRLHTSRQTRTGPKISSCQQSMVGLTPLMRVGPTKLPLSKPGTLTPRPSSSNSAPCNHGLAASHKTCARARRG